MEIKLRHLAVISLFLILIMPGVTWAGTQTVILKQGWNLISTSLTDTRTVAAIFKGVADSVWTYTPSDGWKSYDLTTATGTLTAVPPHQGLWVRAAKTGQVEFLGDAAVVGHTIVDPGWHLLGPGSDTSPNQIKDTLAKSYKASVSNLFAFDPEVGWSFFDFDRNLGTLTALQPGQGLCANLVPGLTANRVQVQPVYNWILATKDRPSDMPRAYVVVFAPTEAKETQFPATLPDFTVLANTPVQFTSFGLQDDGSFKYRWSFGEGAADSNEKSPQKITFAKSWNYTVSLTITSASGSTVATETRKILVTTPATLPTSQVATNAVNFLIGKVSMNSMANVTIFAPGGERPKDLPRDSVRVFAPEARPYDLPKSVGITAP